MSKKQSKPSEFEAMAEVFEILKGFDGPARTRIVEAVDEKIIAEAPKPRKQRSDAGRPRGEQLDIEQAANGNSAAVSQLRRTAEH